MFCFLKDREKECERGFDERGSWGVEEDEKKRRKKQKEKITGLSPHKFLLVAVTFIPDNNRDRCMARYVINFQALSVWGI